jgi:hypothetical protein
VSSFGKRGFRFALAYDACAPACPPDGMDALRVLVIEDDALVAMLLSELLARIGDVRRPIDGNSCSTSTIAGASL